MFHQWQSLQQVLWCRQRFKKLVLDDIIHPLGHTVSPVLLLRIWCDLRRVMKSSQQYCSPQSTSMVA